MNMQTNKSWKLNAITNYKKKQFSKLYILSDIWGLQLLHATALKEVSVVTISGFSFNLQKSSSIHISFLKSRFKFFSFFFKFFIDVELRSS